VTPANRWINRGRIENAEESMAAGSAKPFGGTIGKTVAGSKPWWPQTPKPPQGAPNILIVLFDDVGFSDFGCYGSAIKTPTIDKLAAEGLRYSGFHTTAMCSTTRAALLTGRNHHSVGVGCLANFDSGYPGYRGKIAREAGTLAEMLRPHGYRNYMVGKWHVTPLTESGATGPFDGWPLGRGFDRFYGFMDAETDQYAPELVRDNTPVDPPGSFATGYHLTSDLVDQGIRYIADHVGDNEKAPWLMWLAFGACHAPHQAPSDLIRKYDTLFADGWDADCWYDMRRFLEQLSPQERRDSRSFDRMAARGVAPEVTFAHRCSDRAVSFLDRFGREQDFLLVVSYDEPHDPSICPEPYASMYMLGLQVLLAGAAWARAAQTRRRGPRGDAVAAALGMARDAARRRLGGAAKAR